MDLIQLAIKGLTNSEHPSNAYALILTSLDGEQKLPIIIGAFEAKSIAMAMDPGIVSPRPMTHDLFHAVLGAHAISLKHVIIHRIEDGVFFAKMVFIKHDGEDLSMDARPSDSISLAIRSDCPIFASKAVMDTAALTGTSHSTSTVLKSSETLGTSKDLSSLSLESLQKMLDLAIERENYELAAQVRDEMNQRNIT